MQKKCRLCKHNIPGNSVFVEYVKTNFPDMYKNRQDIIEARAKSRYTDTYEYDKCAVSKHEYCNIEREDGYIKSIIFGTCGKYARKFEPK